MYMAKTSFWLLKFSYPRFCVTLDLALLASQALPGPLLGVFVDAWPHKFFGQQFGCSSSGRMCHAVDDIKCCPTHLKWYPRPWLTFADVTQDGVPAILCGDVLELQGRLSSALLLLLLLELL